jgi:putative endonuclease
MKLPFRKRIDPSPPSGSAGEHAVSHELGRRGEALAVQYLTELGYYLVAANFSLPVGRNHRDVIVTAEIDIVAYDGPTLCFIEVKTRASDEFAQPEINVDLRKRRQVARAARGYRAMFGLMDAPYRYDVVTVISAAKPGDDEPRIELLKNFWSDEKLRKRSWYDARWD